MRVFRGLAIALPALLLGACVVHEGGRPEAAYVAASPDVAFGYSDGYWDRNHQWHQWRDAQEASAWRQQNSAHYYDRPHDQAANGGWRDSDTWWASH
jgi:hypothetical protein